MTDFKRQVQEIEDLQGGKTNEALDLIASRAKMYASILAVYGGELFIRLISQSPDTFDQDLKNEISEQQRSYDARLALNGYNEYSQPLNGTDSNRTEQQNLYKEISLYGEYGINTLNRWSIYIGNNKQLSTEESSLFSAYTIETTMPAPEISLLENNLGFSKNFDISSIVYPDISITLKHDNQMKIQRGIMRILKKMYNPRTGRYGYKEDYMFDNILFLLRDNSGIPCYGVEIKNVIIAGLGDLTAHMNDSEVSTTQLTFNYEDIDIII